MQLFIDTYGAFLHVKDSMFAVRFTKDGETVTKKIAPTKINNILLSKGTSLSFEAASLALMYNIDILFMEFEGTPIGRIWHSKLGSTTKIRKHQLIASITKSGYEFIKEWVTAKINNQTEFLKKLKKHRMHKADQFDKVISKLEDYSKKITTLKANNISEVADQIRGYEGSSGKIYFELLSSILPDEYRFNSRSFRPAADPFNAFLNYAYGVLYSKIEKALIIAGIDPYLGFLHRDDYNQKSMVFDFIEPYRIFADETVTKLFTAKKINQSHTDKITNGYSLNKEGKIILMEAFNNFMEIEKIRYKGKNHTRNNIIQYDAHAFANKLIKKDFDPKEIEKYDLLGDV